MDNFKFLQRYQRLQKGIMYDRLINLGFATVSYCRLDPAYWWNAALANQILSEKQLAEIETVFRSLSRNSTVYFEDKKGLSPLKEKLRSAGYQKTVADSWMFYPEELIKTIDKREFSRVKKVENETDLEIFLKIFGACYQKDDPQNPYGELGENYLGVTKKSWRKFSNTKRLEYFLVFAKNKPVAVSSLTNYKGIGYISNVGSLRQVRGQGFGKLVSLYGVATSQKHGNKIHCLATEEGTYPHEFYKRIGFLPRFTAVGYTKKSI